MFIKDNRRFNPYTTIVLDDVTYQGNILHFPDAVASLGIVEIAEPVPPSDFSDDTYFRTEQDEAPYVVYERKSDEQIRQARLARIPSVTPWQIRKALNQLGLRDAVEAAVAAADQTTKDAWQYSTIFFRDNPLSIAIGYALGKTDEELDEVFLLAATL